MDSSDDETYIPGRPSKPLTGTEHAKSHGDKRVSLLNVVKKVRPHSLTTQALEDKATRDMGGEEGMTYPVH